MVSQKKKIGWGILGPGRIGRDFAASLRYVPDGYVAAAGAWSAAAPSAGSSAAPPTEVTESLWRIRQWTSSMWPCPIRCTRPP